MYTIYFDNKPFFITHVLDDYLHQLGNTHGTILLNQPTHRLIKNAIADLQQTARVVIVLTNEVAVFFEFFKQQFTIIEAGGGLVKNEKNEFLFIYRKGRWDLPKGKWDDGETMEQCALREVKEETGVTNLAIQNFLLQTWHTYTYKGQQVLKQTTWYAMACVGLQNPIPQMEEGITEVIWLSKTDWHPIFANTFPLIKDVLQQYERV